MQDTRIHRHLAANSGQAGLFDGARAAVFHADLHPGNILLLASGELALLDFGSVGRLGKDTRTSLAGFLVAVKAEDNVAAAERLLEMLDPPPELDRSRPHRSWPSCCRAGRR